MTPPPTAAPPRPELTAAKRALLEARLAGRDRAAAIPRAGRGDVPLSFAQERLWFISRLQPESAAYNIPSALRLHGAVDAAAMERALGEIVRRHESLRTVFREVDGRPVQVVAPFAGFRLPVEDLSALDADARGAEAARRATEDAARPFDLTRGPLFRASLLRVADDEHVLLLCVHHIASDGWSMGVLYRELSALYAAYRAGGASPLPELSVQYADFAVWQRGQMRGAALERHLAYWKARLAGAPALLELAADRPRPPVQTHRGAHEPFRIPGTLLARLEALARREDATLYMVLLAGFKALLAAYSGSGDVVVGSPAAGRTRREVEGLIGLFVNTLVLRTELGDDPPFRELLRRVRDATLGAFEHQSVPFEKLVAELQPERSLSYSPLFQVMFTLNDAQGGAAAMGGLGVGEVQAELATTKFDLALTMAGHGGALAGSMAYATDLFDRATIQRMIGHLQRVLEQVAADAELRLSRLDLLPEAERRVVIEAWNQTQAPYPSSECIHTLFQAQAVRTPDALAATDGTGCATYAELNARANRLAHHLRGLGVGPETRVGICQARGVEMLVSMLAVLKAGGAYVPLDPAYPADRLAFTLRDARVAVLLTQQSLRGALPVPEGVHVVAVDEAAHAIARASADNPEGGASPRGLAYLIYTSGSTGVPKGVAIEHESAVALLSWAADLHTAEELGGMLACTSICFDLSVYELFLPLSLGGRVIIVDGALALPSSPVAGEARLLNTVPSAAAALLKVGGIPRGVTTVNLAGEPLRAELVDALYAHGVHRVYDLYGPSEDTTYSTWAHRRAGAPATIGGPIANTRAYVLDAGMRAVPVGMPGELYLGGRGLARGYLGRPSLTADRFLPDPFGGGAGGRLYRTGDRVRWTSGGKLEYLGRLDAQVKVRGHRIEPGEVESALRACEGVHACAVVVREDAPGQRRLVAYVVGHADAAGLRERLRRTLPEYMVPAAFVAMDALPLTPNGKLDRRALPAPGGPAGGQEPDEPRSFLEAQLVQVWEELLGVHGIGATQSFFDLGGDSILALRLLSLVHARLGCELPVSTLFAGATVREMANAVRERLHSAPAPDEPIVALQRHGALPPLHLVHPADRGVMGYVGLVRHLGADQPVYGLRDVSGDPARPLARIAEEYVAAVRSVQPRGPYYLAGWSFGGFVAYEMAVQLERLGETVAFVGLLDSMSPARAQGWPWNTTADMVAALAADLAGRERRALALGPDELRGLDFDAQVGRALQVLRAAGAAPADFDEAALRAQCDLLLARVRSMEGYVPDRFSGTLTLFRATDVPERTQGYLASGTPEEQRTLGWSAVSPRPVDVYPTPGAHATIAAEPHVRELVPRLREALALARSRHGDAPGSPVSG